MYIETLVDMIRVMMNLKHYAESPRKTNIITYILINLKRKMKGDNVFGRKTKTATLNLGPKQYFFDLMVVKGSKALSCLSDSINFVFR